MTVTVSVNGITRSVAVRVTGLAEVPVVRFDEDIMPSTVKMFSSAD